MENLISLTLMAFAAAFLAGAAVTLTSIIGPKSMNAAKAEPFETGEKTFGIVKGHVPIHFYLVALLFVLFDVELIFLFPWALVFREIGWPAFASMTLFLGLLFLTLVYAWKKGVLSWK